MLANKKISISKETVCGCFCTKMAVLNTHNKGKAENIYYLALYIKTVTTPVLKVLNKSGNSPSTADST